MWTRREAFRRAAAFLAATAGPARSQTPPNVVVPFQYAVGRGSILIRARINRKPAVLIVDTGSSHIIIRPALLGIDPKRLFGTRPGAGVIGDAIGQEVTLEVGDSVWPRRRVSIMDLTAALSAYNEPIDGLLGLDFLLEFSQATINLKDRILTFLR
jgi:predicted aspartyl protease